MATRNCSPDSLRAKIPHFLPSQAVNLGLDLQGGSYLLLQVDFDQVTRDRTEAWWAISAPASARHTSLSPT